MNRLTRRILLGAFIVATWSGMAVAQGQPEGQLTIAFDASIAPTFLDPAEHGDRHTVRIPLRDP